MKNNIMKLCALCALGISAITGATLVAHANISSKNEASATNSIDSYYEDADISTKEKLISSLKTITSTGYKSISYSNLKDDAYPITEATTGNYICDYYQKKYNYKISDGGSSATAVGQGWNKEHTIPQSYWGGGTTSQGCDCIIVLPTDIKCNSMRSNLPYGETNATPFSSDSDCKKGTSSFSGYTGTVFEPLDEYKGDLARIYFYAIVRWNGYNFTSGEGNISFSGSLSKNYGLTTYMLNLLEKWHNQDPVSEWELLHNDRVQSVQGNRNPFIDHPEWADWIWFNQPLETKTLTSISKSGTLVKTTYEAGQSFDPEGLTITAKYDDTSEENVTSSVTWSPDPLTQGTTSVTGTYTYKGVSKTVTVSGLTVTAPAPKTLDHISVSGQKTTYYVGDTFVKPTVTAYYTDSTSAVVTNSATFTGFDSSEAGSCTITVTYGGKQYTYQIVVKEKPESESYTIKFKNNGSDDGTDFTSTTLQAYISEGSSYVSSFSNITKSYKGKIGVKMSSGSINGSFTINLTSTFENVTDIKVGIAIYGSDASSLTVNGKTVSTTSSDVVEKSTGVTGDISAITVNATKRVYLSYITIECGSSSGEDDPVLDYIEVTSPKTSYTVGNTFVKPTVIAHYDDGSTQTVTTATFSGYNMSAVGNYTVTVSYGGKTTTYTITVTASSPTHGKSADDPLTTVEAIEKVDDGEKYYIECIIISIKTAWSSQFKNISYWAYTGTSDEFQIFRLGDTADPNYEMGTTLILYSEITQYDGFFETTAAPELIKVITIEEKATAYAEEFNSANVCGTNNNTSAISSIWLEQSNAYSELDTYTRDYLKNATPNEENETIKECLTRYDRVIELHGSDNAHFPDFMNRGGSSSAKRTIEADNDICSIVTLTAIVSGSFTLCYLLFKKRKISKK